MTRVLISREAMSVAEREAYDARLASRAAAKVLRRRTKRAHAWPAWSSIECTQCGAQIGQHCRVIPDDIRLGYRREQLWTTRKRVHIVRWEAYLIAAGREGRQELGAAQRRKGERLRRWPHA